MHAQNFIDGDLRAVEAGFDMQHAARGMRDAGGPERSDSEPHVFESSERRTRLLLTDLESRVHKLCIGKWFSRRYSC